MLELDRAHGRRLDGAGRRFDAAARAWVADAASGGTRVALTEAVAWLQRESGAPLREPIGVIGPREASAEQLAAAEAIGAGLARMALGVVCGGREGVMEAVARGVAKERGVSIGLLPEPDARAANRHLSVVLPTGLGEARNAIIARASFCLVAIGDSYGTLSEVALGLQFGKSVLGLAGAPGVRGVQPFADPQEVLDAVARLVLTLPSER
jgi:uncharacterized protein (TIGR00725 family)